MQFKHPEFLYTLFLLLIPIIVHLFQLRKFQKVAFTNVAFLKEATLKTRKSSQIKKWLILGIRLLLFTAIILAFAQPFTSNSKAFKTEKETVIYLDNSFSMQAKGSQGELLKRAVQDIISHVPETENITLLTNTNVFKNATIKSIKNDLLQLDYTANTMSLEAALLKSKSLFSKKQHSTKHLIFISDFQQHHNGFAPKSDSLTQLYFVKLQPVSLNNTAIDSLYIANTSASTIELKAIIKNNAVTDDNIPVSLFNNDQLIAKASVNLQENNEATFSIPSNDIINGKLTISDTHLQFDNSLFFNINTTSKINVLAINAQDDSFLKRIYTDSEFIYSSATTNDVNYNRIHEQHLIILNALDVIPNTLIPVLNQFTNQGGTLLVIPSVDINLTSYNTLLAQYNANLSSPTATKKQITTINYAHTLYNTGVFEKQVYNFQYPKVNHFYHCNLNNVAAVLKFEDDKPFLFQSQKTYVFTAALDKANSNFTNSPLIVPTLYNIGRQSFKISELYYVIGTDNTFDVETQLKQDDILALVNQDVNIIPQQQHFNNKVKINTSKSPEKAAIYTIKNKDESIKNVSYNYNRSESELVYQNLEHLKNIILSDSVTDIFDTLKSDTKINALWKWFVIFALALLITEMLILKYFK